MYLAVSIEYRCVTDRRTDRQTSCDGIVHVMRMPRSVKTKYIFLRRQIWFFDDSEFKESVPKILRKRMTTGSSNMAVETGNTCTSRTVVNSVEIRTANRKNVIIMFYLYLWGIFYIQYLRISGLGSHNSTSGCLSLSPQPP